jgi:hypothetical protein
LRNDRAFAEQPRPGIVCGVSLQGVNSPLLPASDVKRGLALA